MKVLVVFILFLNVMTATAQSKDVIEIRSYNLKPGTRAYFHRLFREECLPMLARWDVKVLDYGPSLHDTDSYFLVRGFSSVEERERAEDAFYGSEEWKKGPREAVMAQIISYTTIVVPAGGGWVARLRDGGILDSGRAGLDGKRTGANREWEESDSGRLSALNKQFIQNFLHQDAVAHNEIIHPNFVCIESDGSIVHREEYLKNWASDYDHSGYQSFDYTDEFIRIFHDMALVRAKTVYTKSVGGKVVKGYTIYTDTYVKEHGQWKCVQAQITPVK